MIRLTLLLAIALHAAAQTPRPYTQLYVFGDSYSDTGAGFVYSDGPTAVAYLAQRLNIPFTHYGDPNSKGKGLNFAVSGAKTDANPGTHEGASIFRLGMKTQVEEFAALLKSGALKFDPAQTMFFLAGGLNDGSLPVGSTRANEDEIVDTLYGLGARRFMVALLPTKIAAFASVGEHFDPGLARVPADERAKHPDIRIANSNWGPFFDEVITHLAQYGLADDTLVCADRATKAGNAQVCAAPTHFYYFDAHPSTAAHKAVGEMLYAEAIGKAP